MLSFLEVEGVPLSMSEWKSILFGKITNVFGGYYDKIEDKNRALSFVKRQLGTPRNSAKAKAERFMKSFAKKEKVWISVEENDPVCLNNIAEFFLRIFHCVL